MSQLQKYREKLNLTQEQLSEIANVSVRTIQRIEAGQLPKGHTLDALSVALDIDKDILRGIQIDQKTDTYSLIRIINLSSLLLIIVPLGSIIVPLVIMYWKKEFSKTAKQIVFLQVLWSILFVIIMMLIVFVRKWVHINKQIVPIAMLVLVLINVFVILRNAVSLHKNNILGIFLKHNIL